MAENPAEPEGDSEQARTDAACHNGSEAVASNLPMVVAPKLGAGEDEVIDEPSGESAEKTAAAASRTHSSRFLMLAAAVAFAAAFGSFVGSVSGSGLVRFFDPPAPASNVQATTEAMRQTKLELAELSAIKANLDSTTKNTWSQLAKLSDRLDKIDQRSAAVETTGSIKTASAVPQPRRRRKSRTASCRTGSCRTCRAAARCCRTATAACSMSARAACCRASAASTRSSARTVSGSC